MSSFHHRSNKVKHNLQEIYHKLRTSLVRRLDGFDLDGNGKVDISEHDARRLAQAYGLVKENEEEQQQPAAFDNKGIKIVSIDDLDYLTREQGLSQDDLPVENTVASSPSPSPSTSSKMGPLDNYFGKLEVNNPETPPQPSLDSLWDKNEENRKLPVAKLPDRKKVNYGSDINEESKKRLEFADKLINPQQPKKKNNIERLIEFILLGIPSALIGALISFFSFNQKLNRRKTQKSMKRS